MSSEQVTDRAETTENPWKRSYWSLIVTQFQGDFSDNALKYLVIYLIVSSGIPANQRDLLIPLTGALFALPFIFFSMAGGFLADRLSKRTVTIGVKYFEIAVMLIACAGLTFRILPLQFTAIFLMGVHSAVFGPSKYGLMPELLPEKRLSWGNGVLELATFLAIITGTVSGAMMSEKFREAQQWSGVILLLLAGFGLSTSYGINRVPAAAPTKKFRVNFFSDLLAQIRLIRRDRVLFL